MSTHKTHVDAINMYKMNGLMTSVQAMISTNQTPPENPQML